MKRVLASAGILVVLAIALALRPLAPRGLASSPSPARDWAEALARVDSLRAADARALMPGCGTVFLSHGHPTPHVVLMLHGLTNCPAQFDSLGRIAFRRGANVLIPRLPRHGLAPRMSEALAGADAAELRAFTDRVVDVACGLGDSMTVVGLSVGGTLAAWAGQERADVDRVVCIAPMIGVARARGPLTPGVVRTLEMLPNVFVWWDDRLREAVGGPKHVYPRFATRAVAATLRMGLSTLEDAGFRPAACRTLAMVTVGGDIAVDNGLCAELVRRWRARGRPVETWEFPARLGLNHDVVDPEQVGGDPSVTYPVLARLIGP